MMRRLFVGLTVVFGLSVWAWGQSDDNPAEAKPAGPSAAQVAAEGGTHDEAAYRYRTGQASHWRHVMIGGH